MQCSHYNDQCAQPWGSMAYGSPLLHQTVAGGSTCPIAKGRLDRSMNTVWWIALDRNISLASSGSCGLYTWSCQHLGIRQPVQEAERKQGKMSDVPKCAS